MCWNYSGRSCPNNTGPGAVLYAGPVFLFSSNGKRDEVQWKRLIRSLSIKMQKYNQERRQTSANAPLAALISHAERSIVQTVLLPHYRTFILLPALWRLFIFGYMKNKLNLFIFLAFILPAGVSAQPSQKQIDSILQSIRHLTDSVAKNQKIRQNPDNSGMMAASLQAASSGSGKISAKKFPPKNTVLLSSLPKRNLSKPELVSHLKTLYADLSKKLPAAKAHSAQAVISRLNNDPAKISMCGVLSWYKNAPAEAALLTTYAASLSSDQDILNNCGAILNLCGLEQKAIPILKYALALDPKNSTLLNNIGQAYAGLGETDTAKVYLMACISQCSTHPEACATAAYIAKKNGDNERAIELAEQAIKGGYGDAIVSFYKDLKKDANLGDLLGSSIPDKKFFQPNDLEIAPNCYAWSESETVYAKQEAFKKKLAELREQFKQAATQTGYANIRSMDDYLRWSKTQNHGRGPLSKKAYALAADLFSLHANAKEEAIMRLRDTLEKIGTAGAQETKACIDRYEEIFRATKDSRVYSQLEAKKCQEMVAIDNKYFEAKSKVADKFKRDWMDRDIKIYDELTFLAPFKVSGDDELKILNAAQSEHLIDQFMLYSVITCYPNLRPHCAEYDPKKAFKNGDPQFTIANCPLNLEMPFVVGKVNLDCSSFKLELGEGIILNYEKNFITRESTIAVGAGISTHIPGTQISHIPVVNVRDFNSVEAGMKEQFYIKFDRDNQPIDLGMSWEAELDIKGVNSPEIKAGYTVGVNSGWTFDEGPLKGVLGDAPANGMKVYTP